MQPNRLFRGFHIIVYSTTLSIIKPHFDSAYKLKNFTSLSKYNKLDKSYVLEQKSNERSQFRDQRNSDMPQEDQR
ncbi:hypothetical protein FGO68_gene12913 [Halteria grandinella]|uniref:Uncharacterized protein n=1 Tax=Halteria grandinella TaxID=5974 RepID=A0A8J8NNU3_HALGN|nr:hypothetical protein FGO68_gene12913 [Halteria grandinella]